MPQPAKRRSTRKPKQPPAPSQRLSGKVSRLTARPGRQAADSRPLLARNASMVALAGVVLGAATRQRWLLLPALATIFFMMGEKHGARR